MQQKCSIKKERDQVLISKFQSLLRSGKDYSVNAMYEEAGRKVFISHLRARDIINRYYKGVVSQDMIDYAESLECNHNGKVRLFSKKFKVCEREARLLIRYVQWRKK